MLHSLPLIYQANAYPFINGYKIISIKPTANGFKIKKFSNYISTQSIKLEYLPNGFSKAVVKVDTNYQPKYQFTLYFDKDGNEIKANNTKQERIIVSSK
jgi:hypothetical protein